MVEISAVSKKQSKHPNRASIYKIAKTTLTNNTKPQAKRHRETDTHTRALFWYAYPKPITPYEIAKKIQHCGTRPECSKIYPYAKRMLDLKILKLIGKDYQSNPERLVEEMGKDLAERKASLTEQEKLWLLRLLENEFFKEIISSAIKNERKRQEDFDAVSEISNILGVYVIGFYQTYRSIERKYQKEAAKKKEKSLGFIGTEISESTSNDPIEQFLNHLGPNFTKKLIKLLPMNIETYWNMIDEAVEKIQQKIRKEDQKNEDKDC